MVTGVGLSLPTVASRRIEMTDKKAKTPKKPKQPKVKGAHVSKTT
jgi:hypothetical protein